MKCRSLISALLLCLSFNVSALELADAKQQGWVAEQNNGLLAVVHSNAEVEALVAEINTKRQRYYQRIAKENGLSEEQVANLAGKKAIERSASGHLIEATDGSWVAKP